MLRFVPTNFKALLLLVAVALVYGQRSWAGPFPEITGFESDTDTYAPSSHPLADPAGTIYGSPPALSPLPGFKNNSEGWWDSRTGNHGLMEEVPSGTNGITSSHGAFHGEIWATPSAAGGPPNNGDGPYGRPSHSDPFGGNLAGQGDHAGAPARWSFQMDLYLDPNNSVSLYPGNPPSSTLAPDYQWGGTLANADAAFTVTHATSSTYNFGTGLFNVPFATGLATGQWVTLELRYDFSFGIVHAIHNVWNRSHTTLLATFEETASITGSGRSDQAVSSPVRNYFTSFRGDWTSTDHLTVDNLGVGYAIQAVVLGDMNGDGVVNNFDIAGFELALTDRGAYEGKYQDLHDVDFRGDTNGDGTLDNFDIPQFEQLLTSGSSTTAVPEPSSLVLLWMGSIGVFFVGLRRRFSRAV